MRLRSFQVKDYRSIKSTLEINSSSNLTIVGPNNEGKSNLVTALVTALRLLEDHATRGRLGMRTIGQSREQVYNWERDCPLYLQGKKEAGSVFRLKFVLDKKDQDEFFAAVGSTCNENLPITIKIDRSNRPSFEVNKPGKGYISLNGKSEQIARFIGSKLSINYISAVRTARDSARSVEGLVSTALRQVERTPQYIEALQTIQELQRPVLNEIETRLQESLLTFVPSIKRIQLQVREGRAGSLRAVEIGVDDGQLTPLSSKGDGVISLIGMALLARLDTLADRDINLILVIEEPESHLHPRAINAIRNTLDGLPQNIQVMITTHSPNLVSRSDLKSNIIVENNQARVASSISDIREVLGVRVSDNLTSARMNVICEGLSDCRSLNKIFSDIDPEIKNLIDNGEIKFANLKGSGNLSFMVNYTQSAVCEPFVFLDDDEAGKNAFSKAKSAGLISENDVVFTTRLGKLESELEDMLKEDFIASVLLRHFSVDTSAIALPPAIKIKKFSDRIKMIFHASGKNWSDDVEEAVKTQIATAVSEMGKDAIAESAIPIFQTAIRMIRAKLAI